MHSFVVGKLKKLQDDSMPLPVCLKGSLYREIGYTKSQLDIILEKVSSIGNKNRTRTHLIAWFNENKL